MREDFLADWEGASIAREEFLDAGDSVVVRVRQRRTGPGSRAPVEMRYYQVWTLRGSSVIRIESIRAREEALEAVGCASGRSVAPLVCEEVRRASPGHDPGREDRCSSPGLGRIH